MNFIETRRDTGHEDGTEIVYSKAYEALSDFEMHHRRLEHAKKELYDSQMAASDAQSRLNASKEALIDALIKHYDGDIPPAITTAFGTIIFEFPDDSEIGMRLVESRSYCDLYKIEPVGKEVEA